MLKHPMLRQCPLLVVEDTSLSEPPEQRVLVEQAESPQLQEKSFAFLKELDKCWVPHMSEQ